MRAEKARSKSATLADWAAVLRAMAEMTAEQRSFFESKIRPVLVKQCYECHSVDAKKLGGKLLLDAPSEMIAGGESGPSLIPGKPDESLIIQALRYQNKINWARVWALGVLPEYRHLGADGLLIYETAKSAMENGYRFMEASWILANNIDMNRIIENLGAQLYKTYRVYEMEL